MRVLVVTGIYPSKEKPAKGTFVKDQVDSLREDCIDVDVFAFDGKNSATKFLKAGFSLHKILNEGAYDLIHAHYGLTGALSLIQPYCPVVITYHGSDLLGEFGNRNRYTWAGKLKVLVSRLAGLGAAQRIVVANILRTKLWSKSAVTIPMGVDLSLFQPMPAHNAREILGFANNKKLILFAAHPNNLVKRFDIAQKAVTLLQESKFDIELLPVYNLPHHQIPLYMNACDVLLLTSMHEASPCVIKEALACNMPIVSVDVGDVSERIDGVDGCYLCQREPSDVANKLRLALNHGRCSDGRNKISELSLQNVARRVVEVYNRVLSKG